MKKTVLILTAGIWLHLTIAQAADFATDARLENGFSGRVVETTNTAGYTYVLVDAGKQKHWAATTEFSVKSGDMVEVAAGLPMSHYHSKTLNRDFDMVYFAGSIKVRSGENSNPGTPPGLPPGHPPLSGASALPPGHPDIAGARPKAPHLEVSGIQRPAAGKTVAEIIDGKAGLTGKEVIVRGKVVKYNAQILGKNWLHIRDGSGTEDKMNNDLTITTRSDAKLGDTVLVTGKLSSDRDFGAGYKYSLIIEDATVTVE